MKRGLAKQTQEAALASLLQIPDALLENAVPEDDNGAS